jgi:hypothetical protein
MTDFLRDPAPRSVQQLAAGYRNVQVVGGKRKATGDITYSGNLSAGNTITVNGVVFTARASGRPATSSTLAAR